MLFADALIVVLRIPFAAFIPFCLLLTSCDSSNGTPPHQTAGEHKTTATPPDVWQEWQVRSQHERITASLFPQATQVRVYAGQVGISVDPSGDVKQLKLKDKSGRLIRVEAIGGAYLQKDEIALLRRSVFYSPAPPMAAACCVPRHAFTFFDAHNRFLGFLEVCFQCGCAVISKSQPPDPHLPELVWDRNALTRILQAHGVPVTIPVTLSK